jgi:hypothetical protein
MEVLESAGNAGVRPGRPSAEAPGSPPLPSLAAVLESLPRLYRHGPLVPALVS